MCTAVVTATTNDGDVFEFHFLLFRVAYATLHLDDNLFTVESFPFFFRNFAGVKKVAATWMTCHQPMSSFAFIMRHGQCYCVPFIRCWIVRRLI